MIHSTLGNILIIFKIVLSRSRDERNNSIGFFRPFDPQSLIDSLGWATSSSSHASSILHDIPILFCALSTHDQSIWAHSNIGVDYNIVKVGLGGRRLRREDLKDLVVEFFAGLILYIRVPQKIPSLVLFNCYFIHTAFIFFTTTRSLSSHNQYYIEPTHNPAIDSTASLLPQEPLLLPLNLLYKFSHQRPSNPTTTNHHNGILRGRHKVPRPICQKYSIGSSTARSKLISDSGKPHHALKNGRESAKTQTPRHNP